jgi:hypothetical protein
MQMEFGDRRGEAEVQKPNSEKRYVPESGQPATMRCVASHPVIPVEEQTDESTGNDAGQHPDPSADQI